MSAAKYCGRCLTTFQGAPTRCTNLACGADQPEKGWDEVLARGDVLDRHYAIDHCLAVGGAGLTYKARAMDGEGESTGPSLAIKVLFAARDHGPFLRRLANEAQILQALAHPHIVECHGFVSRFGHPPYLVTRFERGGSLQEHVERSGALPVMAAASIVHQILTGLDVAHRAGVVHRDLKPDNVLLEDKVARDEVPHVRVADFGIAKISSSLADGLTRVGMFVGTPEYAAPEQFSGTSAPTPLTDVFACGGLLVFCLTGDVPVDFTHRGDLATSFTELMDALPIRLPASVGSDAERAALDALIERMMQRDPEDRPSVPECLNALAPFAGLAPAEAVPRLNKKNPTPSAASPRVTKQTPQQALATLAPEPTAEVEPVEDIASSGGSRAGAGLALGVVALLGVGASLLIGALVVGAWALGVFDPAPPPPAPDPVPVVPAGPLDLDNPGDASASEEAALLQEQVDEVAPALRGMCGVTSSADVALSVSSDGTVTEALVSPATGLDVEQRACLQSRIEAMSLRRSVDRDATLRVRVEGP